MEMFDASRSGGRKISSTTRARREKRHGSGLKLIDYLLLEEDEEEEEEDEELDEDEEDEEANEQSQTHAGGFIQLQHSLPSYHETNDGLTALPKKKNKKTAMSQEK
ncbi:hypothetical protein B0T13DRAFT_526406 [Neurospora crassa]|nr:hypothetical protein B0T13DRAFT_526406 [Neurospora crassa]